MMASLVSVIEIHSQNCIMLRFCLPFAGVAFLEKLDTILRQKQPILRLKMSILTELHASSYV